MAAFTKITTWVLLSTFLLSGILLYQMYVRIPKSIGPRDPFLVPKPVKKIAVIQTADGPGQQEVVAALEKTLNEQARFKPEIKLFIAGMSSALLRSQIEEVINGDYDLIFAQNTQAAQLSKELTLKRDKRIPIVFGGTGDPVKLGLVETLASSGNHLTGVAVAGFVWIDQMVSLLKLLLPDAKRVFIPYDPAGLGGMLEVFRQEFEWSFQKRGLQVSSIRINEVGDVAQKIAPLLGEVDLLLVLPDAALLSAMESIGKLCEKYQVPNAVAMNLSMVKKGAAMCFGYHGYDVGTIAARMIMQILDSNIPPTEIPVDVLASSYRLGVNTENAKKCGLWDKLDSRVRFIMQNAEVSE